MKVSFTHFSPNAVVRVHYQRGVDYLEHNFDLEFNDTLYLLRELRNDRSSLSVTAPTCHLNFYVESDGSLRVEICLLYTSDAADERSSVDLGGRRIIKKK